MSPPRIFVGTAETAGFVHAYADGLTRAGAEATAGLKVIVEHFGDFTYDLDLGADLDDAHWPTVMERARDPRLRARPRVGARAGATERVAWVIARHDVFLFVYNSLRGDARGDRPLARGMGRDFRDLKRLGKTVIACFVGPDARHPVPYDAERRALGHDFVPLVSLSPSWRSDPLTRALRNVRRAERYADVILSQPNQSSLALRPYHHLDAPFDLSAVRGRVPGREVPVVVHAPSHQGIKGSREILAALERLRAAGVRFELRLLTGVPHAAVCEALRDADVVVDQLHLPMHGRLGVEAMAAGCALATADARDLEPVPAERPVWAITPGGLDASLRRLLTDRALRVALAREGMAYARRRHDHVAVARRILALAAPDTRPPPEHTPTFYARTFALPDGVRLPPALLRASAEVAARWGLPEGVTLADLAARGLAAGRLCYRRGGIAPTWATGTKVVQSGRTRASSA